jgi:AraC-like DNA-binding protein
VEPEDGPPISLGEGDFLFMRQGLARVVWCGARRRRPVGLRGLIRPVQRDGAVGFAIGAGGQERIVLGGACCVSTPEARLFIDALPAAFVVQRDAPYAGRLRTIVQELVDEASAPFPGASPVVARLAEVMVLLGVRAFVSAGGDGSALVEAARDPRLGRALAAIHREPERSWTIARLGRIAGMSRSGFAAAFAERVGAPPASYLARVRMARAERLLLEQDWPLPRIAEAVGYASPAAFSVAFKRLRGVPPGAVRQAP